MSKLFAPEVKREKRRDQDVWVVDCRSWAAAMEKMGHPMRRRFSRREDAQAWCRQLLRDEATGRKPDPGPMALRSLCELYLRSTKKSDKSPTTYASYRSRLKKFAEFLEEMGIQDVREVTPGVIEHYRIHCYDGLTRGATHAAMMVVHSMYVWANRMRYVVGNPAAGLVPRRSKVERRIFTDDERKTLLEGGSPDDLPVWRLLLMTGLRRIEASRLTVEDVVLDTPAPFLDVLGKGNKRRIVPLGPAAQDEARLLVDWARSAGRESLLPYDYNKLGKAWAAERERLKLAPEITLHAFRHDFATRLVNRTGTPLTEAARVLGHASVTQTQIYVHEDWARLRAGMAMLETQLLAETGESADERGAREG